MSRIDITSPAGGSATIPDGMLKTANPLDATLQVVTDNVGNSSTVSLSTTETQINSILRIKTDNAELLDIESSTGNRFNINRVSQNINLDFASKPTDITTQVGAIRTAIDGTNLADVVKFQENGLNNSNGSYLSFIGGGQSNLIANNPNTGFGISAIVGGNNNRIGNDGFPYRQAFIGGGSNNLLNSNYGTISGGINNTINNGAGSGGTISGGELL